MLKAQGWYNKNGSFSVDQIDAEIARLQRLLLSFDVMSKATVEAATPTYPMSGAQDVVATDRNEDALRTAIANVYKDRAALNTDTATKRANPANANAAPNQSLVDALAASEKKLREVTRNNREYNAEVARHNIATLQDTGNKQSLKSVSIIVSTDNFC